jgi:hypothetical protein
LNSLCLILASLQEATDECLQLTDHFDIVFNAVRFDNGLNEQLISMIRTYRSSSL